MDIRVGYKREASYICYDQNNNPNPVDENGNLLRLANPEWFLGPLEGMRVGDLPDGVTLAPSVDNQTCWVTAVLPNTAQGLNVKGDRGDGVVVRGGSIVETREGDAPPAAVIAYLGIQWGPEVKVE